MTTPSPVKTYELHTTAHLHPTKFQIRLEGKTIYETHKQHHGVVHFPQIDILSPTDGSILASAKVKSGKPVPNCFLHLGHTQGTDEDKWIALSADDKYNEKFHFIFNEKVFNWERTHDKETTFKLTVQSDETKKTEPLATIKYNHAFNKHGAKAAIDFFTELGQEAEVLVLAAILGAEERAHWSGHGEVDQASLGFGMPGAKRWIKDGF